MIHNQRGIAQPVGLGGIVRHSYYGRFSRGFHAKDDLFNDFNIFIVEVGSGFIQKKDLGLNDQGLGDASAPGLAVFGRLPKQIMTSIITRHFPFQSQGLAVPRVLFY